MAQDATPATGPAPMAGMDMDMDHGSMPGMDHGSGTASGSTSQHGTGPDSATNGAHKSADDMAGMPGLASTAHSHEDAAPVSRPLVWVVGTFVVVNGLMMAAAAVLRRRRPARPVTRRLRAAAV